MIICSYENVMSYEKLLPYLKNGLDCVEVLRKQDFPTGKYPFEGGYLMVQRGSCKPYNPQAFEAHQKYIDVQYMIQGGEIIYYAASKNLMPVDGYKEKEDIEFFECTPGKEVVLTISPGTVWVAFPEDGHMPVRYKEKENESVKIVMKLPVKKE